MCFRLLLSEAVGVFSGCSSSVAPADKSEVSVKMVQKELEGTMFILVIRCVFIPVFLNTHHKCPLLLGSLEAAMAKFGGCVNEFKFNGLCGLARCVHQQRLQRNTQKYPQITCHIGICQVAFFLL